MVMLPGHVVEPIRRQTDNPNVPPALFELGDVGVFTGRPPRLLGTPSTTGGPPTAPSPALTLPAVHARHFEQDWYDTVHLIPRTLALGNLAAEQVHEVEVWNAHRRQPRQLSALDEAGTAGITIAAPQPAPTTYGALERRVHEVTVGLDGPPVIDATVTWRFPDEAPVLAITGARVLVFGFAPNWRASVRERIAWLTDVLEGRDGSEQRVQLRRHPRRRWEYEVFARDAAAQWLDALLWAWQARVYAVPVWTDVGPAAQPIAQAATEIRVDTTDRDYTAGGLAVVWRSERDNEAVEIETVEPDRLVLARPTRFAWRAGTRVYPARLARLAAQQAVSVHAGRVETLRVTFDGDDPVSDWAAEAPAATYRERPVSLREPNGIQARPAEYRRQLDTLASRTGGVVRHDRIGRPAVLRGHQHALTSRAAIAGFRRWMHHQRGRLKTVWVPTWRQDLTLMATVGSTAVALPVRDLGYERFLAGAPGRRDIALRTRDGEWRFRRIVGAEPAVDGVQALTLDAPIGRALRPQDVALLCWLELVRLEGDAVELDWRSAGVAVCELTWRGVAA